MSAHRHVLPHATQTDEQDASERRSLESNHRYVKFEFRTECECGSLVEAGEMLDRPGDRNSHRPLHLRGSGRRRIDPIQLIIDQLRAHKGLNIPSVLLVSGSPATRNYFTFHVSRWRPSFQEPEGGVFFEFLGPIQAHGGCDWSPSRRSLTSCNTLLILLFKTSITQQQLYSLFTFAIIVRWK